MQNRLNEIDLLRGFAVIGMVFSGILPFNGALPAWMYHAQVPPPKQRQRRARRLEFDDLADQVGQPPRDDAEQLVDLRTQEAGTETVNQRIVG